MTCSFEIDGSIAPRVELIFKWTKEPAENFVSSVDIDTLPNCHRSKQGHVGNAGSLDVEYF